MAHHALSLPLATILAVAVALLLARRAAGYPWYVCGSSSNFVANSTYQAHLDLVTATLPKNASSSPDLFATAVVGTIPEQLWAMGLCRGDVNASTCFNCLTQGFQEVPNDCPYDRDASIYYDFCTVHYSDVHTLPNDDDTGPMINTYVETNDGNVTAADAARFKRLLADLIDATVEYAANSSRRFATGEADFNGQETTIPKVYSVAQCTPDQTPAECHRCLERMVEATQEAFNGSIGGRVLGVDCTYRYETAPFYNGQAMVRLAQPSSSRAPAPAPALQPTAAGEGERKHRVSWVVLAVVLPTLAAMNLVACLYLRRRRRLLIGQAKHQKPPMYYTEAEDTEMVDSMMMDVSTLRAATGDFNESNKLGEGGFGAVYKGVLPDGEEIAVKRLSSSSSQGVEELKNELALVAKLKHRNLVRLIGVCLEQQERLLVYEFVPNRSLDLILFGTDNREQQLSWEQRYKIINGIARGLQYLHEDSQLKVVHRDLKASNILLDESMNPKISDFGMARIFGQEQTQAVTSRVVGTYGYMAPEYMMRGNYSVKSDAFSFGVMVLEIVTGRKNSNEGCNLLTTVWMHWEARKMAELVEPSMGSSFPEGDVLRCVHIGLLCVQADPAARPVMSSVVMMLGSDTVTLQVPSKPGFFARNNSANTAASTV